MDSFKKATSLNIMQHSKTQVFNTRHCGNEIDIETGIKRRPQQNSPKYTHIASVLISHSKGIVFDLKILTARVGDQKNVEPEGNA